MFDAIEWGSFWEWGQPDAETVTYYRRISADGYLNAPDGVLLQAIRTGRVGGKEDELGLVIAPNYGSDWIIWLDWLTEAGLPTPKLDDYFVDADGQGWSIVDVKVKLRQQVVELRKCCAMSLPYPAR